MIVTLKDGSKKEYAEAKSVIDIAYDISEGLARAACAGEVNGEVVDLRTVLDSDCELNILTAKDEKGLAVLRHTASHVLAQAVQTLYPDAKVAIGPSIDTGFYYDFDTFAFFILRRAWSIDDGSIHNGSTMHNHPLLFQTALHVLKELFPYVMFFQQMAEFQKGSSIRNLFTGKVEVHERPHGIAVIDCIFDSSIREVKPVLHKVHTEHGFNASYGASTLTRGIIGRNNIDPVIPGNHLIHGCKEFFALGYLFSMHVLYVSEV